MYTIQNQRINFDLIAFVEITDEALQVNGPGANIVLDRTADPNATHALLIDLKEVRGWLHANGKLVNPDHIVTMTSPEPGSLKVNVAGTEIWVTDEQEQAALVAHHAGRLHQPLYQPAEEAEATKEAA